MTNIENAEKLIEKAFKNFWSETYLKVNNYLSIQYENNSNNNISIQIKSEPIDLNFNSKQPGINRQLFSHTRKYDFKQKEINIENNVNNLNKSFSTIKFKIPQKSKSKHTNSALIRQRNCKYH